MKIDFSIIMKISRNLGESTRLANQAVSTLSSGKRILGAADSTLSLRLNSKIRSLATATNQLNTAKGMLTTADAAVNSQIDLVQRLKDLALQASSDTLSTTQRAALTAEGNSLMEEYRRINRDTEFNGVKLLSQSGDPKNIFQKTAATGYSPVGPNFAMAAFGTAGTVDINGDGKLDLISAEHSAGYISVRLGRGDGTFYSTKTVASDAYPFGLSFGDINGDGRTDMAVADANVGSGSISYYLGKGDGTFYSRVTLAGLESGRATAIGDLNGDGKGDLVAQDASGNLAVWISKGNGSFAPAVTYAVADPLVQAINIADLNNDGKLDITIGGYWIGVDSFINNGDGTFQPYNDSGFTGPDTGDLKLADVNNDGILDAIGANANWFVDVQIGKGDGTFVKHILHAYSELGNVTSWTLTDYDRDGNLDMIIAGYVGTNASINLYMGSGDGVFTFRKTLATMPNGAAGTFAGDFNGDGISDFVVQNNNNQYTGTVWMAQTAQYAAESQVDFSSSSKARFAVSILDNALSNLGKSRAGYGREIERLDLVAEFNDRMTEVSENARSQIEDADMALETSKLVAAQIRQQVQVALLAQVHTQWSMVLDLLNRGR